MQCRVVQRQPFTANTGVSADEWVQLTGVLPSQRYPTHLRRISYTDPESGKALVFLTNNMTLAASTICALYKSRWRVELFFKWIKQHLHIQRFFGTSENALKTQIWCAIATYVLVAITKKQLNLPHTLHDILRQLDLNMFKTTPITQLLGMHETAQCDSVGFIQQSLFSTLGH
jgi:Transposase DDE domain